MASSSWGQARPPRRLAGHAFTRVSIAKGLHGLTSEHRDQVARSQLGSDCWDSLREHGAAPHAPAFFFGLKSGSLPSVSYHPPPLQYR